MYPPISEFTQVENIFYIKTKNVVCFTDVKNQ